MAQKVNPNIFRLGIKKNEWKLKYFETTKEEFSLYPYQSLEIKIFLQKFLTMNGLILHDFKLHYSNNTIYLFISYYTTIKAAAIIKKKKLDLTQSFKLKKNVFYKKLKQKKIKKQSFTSKNLLFPVTGCNKNKIKKSLKKKYTSISRNKKTKKIIQKNLKKKLTVLKNYKDKLKIQNYKNIKELKLNKFSEQLLESIKLQTNNKFNIFMTFQNLNKGLSLNLTETQKIFLKKKLLELRRERRNTFFKETVNILVISVIRKNSAQLLAEFIAYQLSVNKKHNFFLLFVKRFLNTLILEKKFSTISGVKFTIKGRFNSVPRAKKRTYESGNIPTQAIDSNINYYQATSYTPNGTFGIKVWICEK
jgi:hypothetical protein